MNLRKNYKLILFILALVLLVSISAPVDVAKAADGQTVLFDLQTADLAPLLTTGNSGSIPFMRKTGIAGTTYASTGTAPSRTFAVTGRGGTSQGLQFVVSDINVVDNHSYKFDYAGRFPSAPAEVARIRLESGSVKLETATAVGGVFSLSVTRTAAQIKTDAATASPYYSLGNDGSAFPDITYTSVVLTQICPSNCSGNCVSVQPSTTFTHISLTPGATASQVRVSWFTPRGYTPKNAIVQFARVSDLVGGNMPANATQVTGSNATGTSLHDSNKATITGLSAGTEYAYRVGDGTNWSSVFKFKSHNRDKYSVMVIADPQMNGGTSRAPVWRSTMKEAVSKNDFAFILSGGDQMSDIANNDMTIVDNYLSPPELRNLPLATVYGNHDHNAVIGSTKVLPLLYNWPNTVTAGNKGGHDYYFSYGDVLYIFFDFSTAAESVSAHTTTMNAAIASNPTAKWRIVTMHASLYGAGYHSNRSNSNWDSSRASWSKFMDDNKIDIVFSGHDHAYFRSKPMRNNASVNSGQMMANYGRYSDRQHAGTIVNPTGTTFITSSSPCDVDKYGLFLNSSDVETGYTVHKDATAWLAYTHHFNQPNQGKNKPMYNTLDVDGNTLTFKAFWQTSSSQWDMVDSITLTKQASKANLSELVSTMSGTSAAKTAAQTVLAGPNVHAEQYHNLFISMYAANRDSHNCANPGHKCTTCGIATCGGKNCTICGTTCTLANCAICGTTQPTTPTTPTTPPPTTPPTPPTTPSDTSGPGGTTTPTPPTTPGSTSPTTDFSQPATSAPEPDEPLFPEDKIHVSKIDVNGGWIELYNPTDKILSARGLYITNEVGNKNKFRVSAVIIQPKKSVRIYAASNNAPNLKWMQLNFNLNTGDKVYLHDYKGTKLAMIQG